MTTGNDGVSSVVSAVLIFALFSTASMLYAVNTLPERIEGAEAANQRQVRNAFNGLQAGLQFLSAADDEGPFAASVPLAAQPIPLLQRGTATGVLSAHDDAFRVQATWPNGTVAPLVGDQPTGIPDQPVPATLTNVTGFSSLVVGLDTNGITGNNKFARVQATSTSGGVTVTIAIEHTTEADAVGCTGTGVVLTIAVTGFTTTSRPILCGVGDDLGSTGNPHAIDLLDEPGVTGALGRLAAPYNLTLSASVAGGGASGTGTYMAVWTDGTGALQVSGQSGQAYTTPLDRSSDVVAFTPALLEYPSESILFEGGAVVAKLGSRQAVISPPSLSLQASGSQGHLAITLVLLQATGSRSGTGVATATVTHASTTHLLLSAPGNVSWTFTTPEAPAWASMFDEARLGANLTGSQVAVASNSSAATVDLRTVGGLSSWTVSLRLVEARVVAS